MIIIGIIDKKVFKENSVKLRNSFAELLAIRISEEVHENLRE